MILQEKQLFKFGHNIENTSGRGPSQGVRMVSDKGGQIKIAEDFMDITSDEEALEQEAMESVSPSWCIPKRKTKHRPPENKSKFLVKKMQRKWVKENQMKGKNKKKGKEINEEEEDDEQEEEDDEQEEQVEEEEHRDERRNENKLQRKLKIAADIVEGTSVQRRRSSFSNLSTTFLHKTILVQM